MNFYFFFVYKNVGKTKHHEGRTNVVFSYSGRSVCICHWKIFYVEFSWYL